jgi:hypothetical protein
MTTYRTIKVHLKGNDYYPDVLIIRDGDIFHKQEYPMNERRMKWLDDLFASHTGNIYIDFRNSNIELMKVKRA